MNIIIIGIMELPKVYCLVVITDHIESRNFPNLTRRTDYCERNFFCIAIDINREVTVVEGKDCGIG